MVGQGSEGSASASSNLQEVPRGGPPFGSFWKLPKEEVEKPPGISILQFSSLKLSKVLA